MGEDAVRFVVVEVSVGVSNAAGWDHNAVVDPWWKMPIMVVCNYTLTDSVCSRHLPLVAR